MRCGYSSILCIFLLLAATACQEPYDPGPLNSNEMIPVIEGSVSNGPGPFVIHLSWASPFGKKLDLPISGAWVMLSDDMGLSEVLAENAPGVYVTSASGIPVSIGKSYKLTVRLPNGDIFESPSQELQSPPWVDSVYAEIGTAVTVKENLYGDLIETKSQGLHVMADVTDRSDKKRYYRFSTRLLIERYHTLNPNTPSAITVFCYDPYNPDQIPQVFASAGRDGKQLLRSIRYSFLPYIIYPEPEDPSVGKDLMTAWVLQTRVSVFDQKVYDFYRLAVKQLQADQQIFDPVPSQIKGNMVCRNNPEKIMIGMFEVASVTTLHHIFTWFPGSEVYHMRELKDYQFPEGPACREGFPPPGWIYF